MAFQTAYYFFFSLWCVKVFGSLAPSEGSVSAPQQKNQVTATFMKAKQQITKLQELGEAVAGLDTKTFFHTQKRTNGLIAKGTLLGSEVALCPPSRGLD